MKIQRTRQFSYLDRALTAKARTIYFDLYSE